MTTISTTGIDATKPVEGQATTASVRDNFAEIKVQLNNAGTDIDGKEPADATILKDADIGVNVQAYDATILKDADIGATVQAYDATYLVDADIGVTVQAYDVELDNVTADSIAALRLVEGVESQHITVLSYYAPNYALANPYDGGGGSFAWDATSTETDNGGTIIKATAVTTGRWIRLYSGAVNVRWFGATGDGDSGTDNTVLVQAAVNSFPAAGGTIHFTGGINTEYWFDTQTGPANPTIQLPSNVHILIDNDVVLLTDGGVASGVNGYNQAGSTQKALFVNSDTVNGNTNISISGGSLKSSAAAATGSALVAMQNVIGFRLLNINLLDTWGACRGQISYCKDALISNVRVGYDAIHAAPFSFEDGFRIGSGCNGVNVVNFTGDSGDDFLAITNEPAETQNTLVSTSGVAYNVAGASIFDVNITNIRGSTQAGNLLRIYNEATMTVGVIQKIRVKSIGGTPVNTGAGNNCVSIEDFNSRHAIKDVKVNGVDIDCSNNTGGAGINLLYADDVKITDPTLDGYATYGIVTNNCPGTEITNPTVRNGAVGSVDAIGIFASSTASNVRGGRINGAVRDGVRFDASNQGICDGVEIVGSAGNGVHITGSSQHTRIKNNIIPSSTGAAIKEDAGCDWVECAGNDVVGATAIDISTSGSNSRYHDNPGYNPVGSFAIGTGASPFTYTTGASPELVTVGGGTVSNITIGGVGMAIVTGEFMLPARTAIVVTHSVAPTMTKHIH
jgi:hypothetical protein